MQNNPVLPKSHGHFSALFSVGAGCYIAHQFVHKVTSHNLRNYYEVQAICPAVVGFRFRARMWARSEVAIRAMLL